MKKSLIVLLIILGQMPLFAQRNPYNEILVYFNTGVSQETRMISGQLKKIANLYSESLKENLAKIGIEESMIEVAMPNFIQADTIKTFQDGTKLRQPDMTKLFRVTPHSKKDIIQTIGKLSELPQVGYAHQNGKVASCLTPDDEYFEEQWNLYNPITLGADIHTLGAWDTYTGNLNNIIGIIDWGVDGDHEDLNAKISGGDTGYSIDDPNHGTHVAGIAAAESNNNQGISGVDWNARIHSKRVDICLDDADLYESIIAAINYSSNVKVINNSWECIYEDRSPGRYSYTIGLAFAAIYNANRTPVAAMGNREDIYPGVISVPAAYENVISVGASDNIDHIAFFSRTGNHIDVVAPGVNITSTFPDDDYDELSGTSMATPHVSGLASLLVGYNSSLTVNDISNIINLSVDDINYPDDDQIEEGFDVKSGHGRINAERALSYLTAPYSINQWSSSNGTDYGTSGATMVLVGIPNLNNGLYIVVKHEVRKSATFPTSFYNIIGAWGRGVNTNGFSTNNPNYGMGFCEVVPGTLTNTGATLRTYVYQVYTYPNCVYLGYYPTTPSNVTFAYTVLGIVNPTISGPTLICSSPNSTFTLSNRPTGTTVTWRKSNNLTYVSGQGTDNYTVNALSSGPGWIRPTVYFGSDSLTLPQYILWVGTPQFNISGPYEGCPNVQYTFEAIPKPYSNPSYDYSWAIYPNDGYISTSNGGRYAYITFYSVYSVAGYDVKVRAQNTCGLGDYSIGNIWIHECYDFLLSPNPASEILTITKIESESNNSNSKKVVHNDESIIYTIRILDSSGGIHYATKKSGSSFSIPISSLKNGNYIVQIVNGGNRINKQLVIKH